MCVCGRGCVCCVVDTFIVSPQLNPHRAADSGGLRSGGELANGMKVLTLLAHSLLQDSASHTSLQAPQVEIHSQTERFFFFFPFPVWPYLLVGLRI